MALLRSSLTIYCLNDSLTSGETQKGKEYFDGCIRDEKQARLAYRYTMLQGERHGIVNDFRNYPHTRIGADVEETGGAALKNGEFLEGVPYKRYQRIGPAR